MYTNIVRLVGPTKNGIYAVTHSSHTDVCQIGKAFRKNSNISIKSQKLTFS